MNRTGASARARTAIAEGYPPEVTALLERGDAAAAALTTLAAGTDRATAKAARRALYALRQAGVAAEPLPSPAVAQPQPAVVTTSARITNPDGNGRQMILFLRDDPHGGWPWFVTFIVDYASGIRELAGAKRAPREVEQRLDELGSVEGRYVTEVPVDYARQLLAEAADRNRTTGTPIPQGYAELRRRIGDAASTWERPLIYDHVDEAAVRSDESTSRDPKALFLDPMFRTWIISLRAVRPWLNRLYEASQSPIELSEAQKKERTARIIDEATDSLMSPETLPAYRRLLEESALVAVLAGRTDAARMALYHAVTLGDEGPPHERPFLRAIVERSVAALVAYIVEQQGQSDESEDTPDSEA